MFDFLVPNDTTIENLKNKKILELSQEYLDKTLAILKSLSNIPADLLFKIEAAQKETQMLINKANATAQDIQILLSHIKDINETIQTCKDLASALVFIFPLFDALAFFIF